MAFSSNSAVLIAATQPLAPSFCLASSAMNSKSVGQQAAITIGALEQSAQGLQEIANTKETLTQQLDDGVMNVPSAAAGKAEGGPGMASFATSIGVGAALTAVNPVLGAAFMAYDAISGAAQHLGTIHASMTEGSSEPLSKSSSAKSDDSYTDVSGDTYQGGFKMAENRMVKPVGGASPDPMTTQRGMKSQNAIDRLGEDEVRTQLAETSVVEKQLKQQAGAAMQFAENRFGVVAPANPLEDYAANNPQFKKTMGVPAFG